MHRRAYRRVVAAVLVAAGIAGGFCVFDANRKAEAILTSSADLSARFEGMIATAGNIASAQQAYVAPGQPDQPALERGATVLQQFADDLAAARPRLRSPDASRLAARLADGLNALVTIDGKARLDLEQGQNLLAADLIFSEGRDAVATLVASIRTSSAAEQALVTAQRADLAHTQWGLLAIVGLIWLGGLMLLVPLPTDGIPAGDMAATTHPPPQTFALEEAGPGPASVVDLASAAQVCTALAQVADAATLPALLARAAEVLDARGIIVWMGAGEELFAALTCGYDNALVDRLGPIPRNAANATADAWRTGQMRMVAGDVMSHGALAAPLCGVDGCVGVFAAEVRRGREADPSTRAVASMFAAQLAGIVPAWPAGSAGAPNVPDSGPVAASGAA